MNGFLKSIALVLVSIITMVSCRNEDSFFISKGCLSLHLSDVPLQISVENTPSTRSILTGDTLPNGYYYQVYGYANSKWDYVGLNSPKGTHVRYENGISEWLGEPIYLPDDNSDISIVAFIGSPSTTFSHGKFSNIHLQTNLQNDFLIGRNTNAVNKTNPKASIRFEHLMSRVTLNVKKSLDSEKSYKIPTVTLKNLASEATLTIELGTPHVSLISSEKVSVGVKPTNYVLDSSSDVVTVDFLVLPVVQEGITIKLDGFSQEIKLPIAEFGMGQQYTYNVVIGNKKTDVSEVDGHEYVDLGLPSGTKWATHNLDMTQPNKETASVENYGSYCYWADPIGEDIDKSENVLPSPVPPSSICGTDYDIAHVQWGKKWRLPTSTEEFELRSECTWEFIEVNGIKCGKAIGPNGNFIILPMGGFWFYTAIGGVGRFGEYWTGNSYESNGKYYAEYMRVSADNKPNGYGQARNARCLIRPVLDE